MKITPKALDNTQADQATLIERQKHAAKAAADATSLSVLQNVLGSEDSDKVNVSSLASALNGEFSPAQIASERQTKLDKIKAEIANGTYKPSSEYIAKAIADEISQEILSSGGLLQAEN